MSAREAVLGRVRAAIGEDGARPSLEPMPPSAPDDASNLVARFAERVEDYRSTVTVVGGEVDTPSLPDAILRAGSVAAAVDAACVRTGARRLGVPEGFDGDLVPDGVEAIPVVPGTRESALSFGALDAVVCTAPLGIAETGTIVLDAGTGQGPRAASLLPDVLIVVIDACALVGGVVAAVDRMRSVVAETARPLTMISGPSATSDIELDRVEGVHGPRTLEVIVVDGASGASAPG